MHMGPYCKHKYNYWHLYSTFTDVFVFVTFFFVFFNSLCRLGLYTSQGQGQGISNFLGHVTWSCDLESLQFFNFQHLIPTSVEIWCGKWLLVMKAWRSLIGTWQYAVWREPRSPISPAWGWFFIVGSVFCYIYDWMRIQPRNQLQLSTIQLL